MTSLKTWYLLFLAAFLFLSTVPTVAEVVKSVELCDQFFLDGNPPQVPGILEGGNIVNQNQYKAICQTYANEKRFVTLYDIKNKIPVFSAYKYRGQEGGKRPPNRWNIEPQLEDENSDKNMRSVDKNKTYAHQAGNIDYKGSGTFDRGHLIPSSYGFNRDDKKSTFTLTNIVPQARTFNQGSWNKMEERIKCVMNKHCINRNGHIEGFVVTGAKPSTNNILKNKVNIPSMLWSAFCCYSSNLNTWIASAHWGNNVPDGSPTKYLQTKTLAELHQRLTKRRVNKKFKKGKVDSEFQVFPGSRCPLNTTVSKFYPKRTKCNSPPSISTTSAPLTSTSTPPTSTSTPPTSTSTPPTSTSTPPTSTSAPLTSTSTPPTSTSALLISTSTPPTSTSALLTSTSTPPTSTSVPLTSTSAPPTTTCGHVTTTSG